MTLKVVFVAIECRTGWPAITGWLPDGQVSGFLAEQERHLQEAPGPLSAQRELLGVLRVLAEHSGSLHLAAPTNARGPLGKDQVASPGVPSWKGAS